MNPVPWEQQELDALVEMLSGGTPSKSNASYWGGTIPWISAKDIKSFYLGDSGLKVTEAGAKNGTRLVDKGTILILVRGMALKKDIPLGITTREVTFNQDVKALIPKTIDPNYLGYYLFYKKPQLMRLVTEAGHGTGRLQTDLLRNFPVVVPSQWEQKRLSAIFALWDEAILLSEKILVAKTGFRNGLMEQLLSGRRRFPNFQTPWEVVRFSDITREQKQRNKGAHGVASVHAVTNQYGMIPMRERVRADNLDRYKVVRKHEFAYNPMRLNVGSICMWEQEEPALVSPDYVVFQCEESCVLPHYMNYLRQIHRWNHYVQVLGSGSVRVRIYYKDLANIVFNVPSLEEQEKIVDLLVQADYELTCYKKYISELRRQQKALMQLLLSGKKRLKADCMA